MQDGCFHKLMILQLAPAGRPSTGKESRNLQIPPFRRIFAA
jgi:hypothetical protein